MKYKKRKPIQSFSETMNKRVDVAIIGAGPAGIAAATQLRRSGLSPLVFEKERVGGLLNNAFLVENYPGFPQGISGLALVNRFRQHLKKWGISIFKEQVVDVYRDDEDTFILKAKKQYTARIVIVSSGTKPKQPKINIDGFQPQIFFEIYPIRKIKNRKIVIVGTGDAAFDYALNLGRYNHVIILNRSDTIKALPLLYNRIRRVKNDKSHSIKYLENTKISTIKKSNNKLIAGLLKKNQKTSLSCDYMLFAIGREPAIDFLSSSLRHTFPHGDNKRIYFVGDVRRGNLRQTAIAIGDGIHAAMKVCEYLRLQKTSKR